MRKIISILVFGIFFYAEAFAQTLVAKTSRTDLPEGCVCAGAGRSG